MLMMIDNYDSFTYNLVQYLGEIGEDVKVYRNDKITLDEIAQISPNHIVLSPGPGTPNQAGICLELVERFAGRIPILGVCLGHQCIAQAFGADIVRAKQIMHGKTSMIHHQGRGVFQMLGQPFEATRYHSLVMARSSTPACLEITAWTLDEHDQFDEIMGIQHQSLEVVGVQFHPESILTEYGHDLLRNFLARTR